MKITIDLICECGNSENFLEIDIIDYTPGINTYKEFVCKKCYKRITIIKKEFQLNAHNIL